MPRIIYREPPENGVGVVVFPNPTLPGYARASVDSYRRQKPDFPSGRRGPFPKLDITIGAALTDAQACNGDVWVIAERIARK
jgi:hypothetical protein